MATGMEGLFWNVEQEKHLWLNIIQVLFSRSTVSCCFASGVNCKNSQEYISPGSYEWSKNIVYFF